MNRYFFAVLLIVFAVSACQTNKVSNLEQTLTFSSSDSTLVNSFNWAMEKALSYVGNTNDPSGPWYEAALPEREAFCMRDVSHQCIAGEYLGLHEQNLNMMKRFASNISESKDWCTYWEINRYNQPAPVDYRNDKEFWYNLPANFDVLQACYRLYKISGDDTYIKDLIFLNFYEKTVNEYIDRWQLNPGQLYIRDRFLNTPEPINMNDNFHIARGLPSYIESSPVLNVGSDLIAALYAGLDTYANILELNGSVDSATVYRQRAKEYTALLDRDWWDESQDTYYSFNTIDKKFEHSEPVTFLLWFDAIKNPTRLKKVLEFITQKTYNVENTSYLPYLLYKHGKNENAYSILTGLTAPSTKRRDYPEVSYGVIHGFIEGLMGIAIDFDNNTISLKPNLTTATMWAKLENLKILSTELAIKHEGTNKVTFNNNGNAGIKVKFCFDDKYNHIILNGKEVPTTNDINERVIYCTVDCDPGNKLFVVAR